MTIGIIAAMAEELNILLKDLILESTTEKASMTFYKGKLYNQNVIMVICGIGKVNAAICTQLLISEHTVAKIINIGVAGGIGADICPGDIIIGDTLVHHDVDITAFGHRHGQIARMDTFDFKADEGLVALAKKACEEIAEHKSFIGRIASGDQFVATYKKAKWIDEEFGALSCEMEGASIAQTCYLNTIPFVIIRCVSDNANTGAFIDFQKFLEKAVINSTLILKKMLEKM